MNRRPACISPTSQRLLDVLDRLVETGNTVLVIEHNLDMIRNADWVIDLGPEGGDRGGEIVAEGPPKEIAKVKRSYTGQVLKEAGCKGWSVRSRHDAMGGDRLTIRYSSCRVRL
jgi:ABC-type Mn2+/Zn2+ transport system ATPase subunit